MKILYAIQGTGNGHISRARDIIPLLNKKGNLDILISGVQADISLPYPVTYQYRGMSFIIGKGGGVDFLTTLQQTNISRLRMDILRFPVEEYDLIINDFEPVSAWACKLKGKHVVGLSHQSAVLNSNAPRPKRSDLMGRMVLQYFSPTTADYGFHFCRFDENIFTPVIRRQIRKLKPTKGNYFTVYLPAYSDEKLVRFFSHFPGMKWNIFSKHNIKRRTVGNICLQPVDNDAFIHSLAHATGLVCGAGFESPAEALYLGKKVLCVPMKNQYEQYCNAAALESLGVPVISGLKKRYIPFINNWLQHGKQVEVNYPDQTEEILDMIIEKHV